MPLSQSMKLSKLTITSFATVDREVKDRLEVFEAMFNPASYSESFGIAYSLPQVINAPATPADYMLHEPGQLKLKLILDGTGVDDTGLELPRDSVKAQIAKFKTVTYKTVDKKHEASFLKVEWGANLILSCRLRKLDINYVSFDRDGEPLRAELDILLISDQALLKTLSEARKSSPDLTHSRMVKSGDTLPLLCMEIYGSAHHYIRVAQANNLDNFRNLKPGQELVFPPLEKQTSGRSK